MQLFRKSFQNEIKRTFLHINNNNNQQLFQALFYKVINLLYKIGRLLGHTVRTKRVRTNCITKLQERNLSLLSSYA